MERKKGFPLNNKLFYVSGMFLNWNSQKLFLERIILAVGIEKFGSLWESIRIFLFILDQFAT